MDELRTVCDQAHKTAEMLRDNSEWMIAIQSRHSTIGHDGPAIQVKREALLEMVPEEEIEVLPIAADFAYIYTTVGDVLFFSWKGEDDDV